MIHLFPNWNNHLSSFLDSVRYVRSDTTYFVVCARLLTHLSITSPEQQVAAAGSKRRAARLAQGVDRVMHIILTCKRSFDPWGLL